MSPFPPGAYAPARPLHLAPNRRTLFVSNSHRTRGAHDRRRITSMHEVFEHTADLGLRIRSPQLDTLFAEAGEALFAAIVEDLATVAAKEKIDVRVVGDDRVYLLFDWLNELLYRWDSEHWLFSSLRSARDGGGLGRPPPGANRSIATGTRCRTR